MNENTERGNDSVIRQDAESVMSSYSSLSPPMRLKFICRLGYGDALPKEEELSGDVPAFGSNGPYSTTIESNTLAPAIVVGRKGSYGKVNWAPSGCFASDTTFFIDSNQTSSNLRWLYWALQTLKLDEGSKEAAVPGLNRESVYEQRVIFPDQEAQRLIADYLDRETARIDALLAEKEKMLALLEEKRAALISRAVTRGLNPDAPLKPSGLDWLGDIPAHWNVWKLKYVVSKIGSGITPRGGAESYQSEGVPLFRSQNIHFDGLRMDDIVFIDSETHESMSNSKIFAGDVLINITGASIGRCFYIEEMQSEANVNQHVCIVRPSSQIETKFLYFTLRSDLGQHQIDLSQSGSGREGLNFESLGNFSVVIPPANEQREIIKQLETVGQKSAVLLTEIRNSISRLIERRAALITGAVTGRIPIEAMRS